jgi:aryl-alcohol dehydrogenase-like predicted oxidoreductase
MEYTTLGKSNAKVSRICLGTMHYGTRASEEESFRIMDRALELGINFFDTADIYGGAGGWGLSEEIIGRWLAADSSRRDRIVLATKVYWHDRDADPWPNVEPGISEYKIRKSVAGSLRRLQTDTIDLYQVHHIDRGIRPEEFWFAFERLRLSGDVAYIGTSNFPAWGLAKHQAAAAARGDLGIVSEQHMYNLYCRYPELEVLPAALALDIGILAYMPLAGGLLTGNRKPQAGTRTADVSREYAIALDQNDRLDRFEALAAKLGVSPAVLSTAWVLANPAVTSAIVGVRTVEQLEGVVNAASLELAAATLEELGEQFPITAGRPLRNNQPSPEAYAW